MKYSNQSEELFSNIERVVIRLLLLALLLIGAFKVIAKEVSTLLY